MLKKSIFFLKNNKENINSRIFQNNNTYHIFKILEGDIMPESIYKIIELVSSSEKSWQDAIEKMVEQASKTLRDLRIAEVVQMDVKIDNGKIVLYRVRARLSFKYEGK